MKNPRMQKWENSHLLFYLWYSHPAKWSRWRFFALHNLPMMLAIHWNAFCDHWSNANPFSWMIPGWSRNRENELLQKRTLVLKDSDMESARFQSGLLPGHFIAPLTGCTRPGAIWQNPGQISRGRHFYPLLILEIQCTEPCIWLQI